MESTIQSLVEKAYSDARLSAKRLEFIKFNLEEVYGKTWQLLEFPADYDYGKAFSTNTDIILEFRRSGSVFIFWQTNIVLEK
jgi:hypothetical protein